MKEANWKSGTGRKPQQGGPGTRYLIGALLAATLLGGCKYLPSLDEVLPDKKKDYQKSESLPDLEVPPDLSSGAIKDTMAVPEIEAGAAKYSTYQERIASRHQGSAAADQARATAPGPAETAGSSAPAEVGKLRVRGTAAEIWPKLRSFWQDQGYRLAEDDLRAGRMATEWLENERQLTREKFELRATADNSGTTVLSLQRSAQAQKPEGEHLVWVDTPASDSVSPWLSKLEEATGGAPVSMVSSEELAAQRAERDRTEPGRATQEESVSEILFAGEGKKYLLLGSSFADAWRTVAGALNEAGIEVEDKDESRGVFHVRYYAEGSGKPGFLSRLAFWRATGTEAKHQVSITAVGRKTEVVVLDNKGDWENDTMADQILEKLQTRLKQAKQ